MDLHKPLVTMTQILSQAQAMEYEGLHQICFECDMYAHRLENCSRIICEHGPDVAPERGIASTAEIGGGEDYSSGKICSMDTP